MLILHFNIIQNQVCFLFVPFLSLIGPVNLQLKTLDQNVKHRYTTNATEKYVFLTFSPVGLQSIIVCTCTTG